MLGIDWLELYSPMEVHWQAKWLSIPYKGDTVVLQGLTSVSDTELVVQLLAVEAPDSNHNAVQLPEDISALLAEFPSVFKSPTLCHPSVRATTLYRLSVVPL